MQNLTFLIVQSALINTSVFASETNDRLVNPLAGLLTHIFLDFMLICLTHYATLIGFYLILILY